MLPVALKASMPLVSDATNRATQTEMNVDQHTSSVGLWAAHCPRFVITAFAEEGNLLDVCKRMMVQSVRDFSSRYMEGILSKSRDRVDDKSTGRSERSNLVQYRLPKRRSNDRI